MSDIEIARKATKQNIKLLNPSGSLSLINSLNPVEYNFIKTPDKERIGFIAQSSGSIVGLEDVLPQMVTSAEGIVNGESVSDFRTINTGDLTYLLVSAVQELSQKVKDLELQISGSR